MNVTADQAPSSISYNSSLMSLSAVSWGAILAGAIGAAAMSLILLILGMGLGLSSVSPWTHSNMSGETLGIASILWIFFASFASSGLGGYLAGRLRTRWLSVPLDEVHFRDTAHGFLAWAIATLGTAILLTTVIGKILVAGFQTGASVAGGMMDTATVAGVSLASNDDNAQQGRDGNGLGYTLDTLFRRDPDTENATQTLPLPDTGNQGAIETDPMPATPSTTPNETGPSASDPSGTATPQAAPPVQEADQETSPETASVRPDRDAKEELGTILLHAIRNGSLAQEDVRYAAAVLANELGISRQEAEQRVNQAYTAVREAENTAREMADDIRAASAKTALWLFISLLIGAFIASLSATWGGRQRDL